MFGKLSRKFKETGFVVHKAWAPGPTTWEEVREVCGSPKGFNDFIFMANDKFVIYIIKINNAAQRTEEVCNSINIHMFGYE